MGAIKEFGVNLVANVTGFKQSMQQAAAASKKFKKDIDETMKGVLKVGAPMGALAIGAVKLSADFESAFAGVKKTLNASKAEFENIRQSILQMSREMPASAVEIANVAEAAAQLGVEKENIKKFTETMIKLGEATDLSSTVAAEEIAKFANVMKMPLDEVDKLGASLVALGSAGASTESAIMSMAGRLSAGFSNVKTTTASVLGLATALSDVGIEAEMGGTAMGKVVKQMAVAVELGGKELDKFIAIAGPGFKKAFEEDATKAIVMFLAGLNKIKESGGSIFQTLEKLGMGEERLSQTVLKSASAYEMFAERIDLANEKYVSSGEERNALDKEYEERLKTASAQVQIAVNNLSNLAIEFGSNVLPALVDVSKAIVWLTGALTSLGGIITDVIAEAIVQFIQFKNQVVQIAIDVYEALATIPTALNDLWKGTKAAFGTIPGAMGDLMENTKKAFSDGFDTLSGSAKQSAQNTQQSMKKVEESLKAGAQEVKKLSGENKNLEGTTKKLSDAQQQNTKTTKELISEQKKSKHTKEDLSKIMDRLTSGTTKQTKEQKEAEKQAKKLREEEEKRREELERSGLAAVEAVRSSERYKEILKQVEQGLMSQEDAYKIAGKMTEEYRDATAKVSIAQEKLKDVTADVAEGIQDPTAINNAIANLERFEKKQKEILEKPKAKGGFWDGLLGSITSGAGGIGQVAEGAFEKLGGDIAGIIGSAIEGALQGGFNRESFASLMTAAGGAAGAAFGIPFADQLAAPIATTLSNIGKSTGQTIKGSLLALGPIGWAAQIIPDSFFESAFGESAATAARKAADKFFADAFDKNRLSLVINGQLQQITDLQFSGNQEGGGLFGTLEEDARKAFEGVGMAAEMALGIATDMGVNLGNVFANNVGGSLNNLQILLQQAGLTADQLKTGIVQAFRNADMSATEAFNALKNVEEVTKKGIPGAVGATEQAFENLINSAGRGLALIDSLGDLGAEGLEKGTQGLEGLKEELVASGKFSREEVEKLFNAISSVGISTLEELRDVTDETAIAIAANLEGAGFGFGPLKDDLKEISSTLKEIPKSKDVQVNIKANISPEDRAAIGLVTDGKLGGSDGSSSSTVTPSGFQEIQGKSIQVASSFMKSATKKASTELAEEVKQQVKPSLEVVEKENEKSGEKVRKTWFKKFGDIFGNKQISKAFSEIAGDITKETSKIAQAIAKDVNKSLADMQLLLHETGVSVSQLGDKIVDQFLKKTMSATEAAAALKQLADIEQVGDPTKQGAIAEAIEKLKTQGGKGGFEALNAIKGVVQEASEVIDAKKSALEQQITGIRDKAEAESRSMTEEENKLVDRLQAEMQSLDTLEALRTQMIATGKATENDINAIYIAMKDSGLDSIKAIVDATEKELIPVLAKLSQMSFFQNTEVPEVSVISMDEEGNIVDKKKKKKGKRDKKKLKSAMGNVFGAMSAMGSVVASGMKAFDLGTIAEEGPEAIMPLKRMKDGRLGVAVDGSGKGSESITININASDITVARKIADAVKEQLDTRNRAPGRAF